MTTNVKRCWLTNWRTDRQRNALATAMQRTQLTSQLDPCKSGSICFFIFCTEFQPPLTIPVFTWPSREGGLALRPGKTISSLNDLILFQSSFEFNSMSEERTHSRYVPSKWKGWFVRFKRFEPEGDPFLGLNDFLLFFDVGRSARRFMPIHSLRAFPFIRLPLTH